MDKNLFTAVALSMLIYLGWYSLVEKRYARPPAPATAAAPSSPEASPAPGMRDPDLPAAAPSADDDAVSLEAGRISLRVRPAGASIVSFRYPGPLGPVELVPEGGRAVFFSTWPELRFLPVRGKSAGAVFEAVHPGGARLRKEFVFSGYDSPHLLRLTLTNPRSTPVSVADLAVWLGPGLGTVASELKENPSHQAAVALRPPEAGKKRGVYEVFKAKDGTQQHSGPWSWLGLSNRYFLAALLPPADAFGGFQTGGLQEGKHPVPWLKVEGKPLTLAPGQSVSVEIPFYFGPKGYTHLSALGLGLERSVDFGWFHRLGRTTLKILDFLHEVTGNWGWSILLLTVMLQFLLFPLTFKSLKAAAAMKRVQPEVTRIQQKFAKDPRRMNAEMMELYKKHGANPLGGCLPMLVQMPVFIALYNTIRNAWELHGAPWALWIRDLSAQDPYYVLPLVMGGVMFLQNKLNPPAVADPAQAKVMTFMPLMFTFMFLKFPAGLVLYWLTNSVVSAVMQTALKRRLSAA